LPVADTLTIDTDTVVFSGFAHVVLKANPTSPADPYRVQINLHNVVGLGDSGQTYQILGTGVAEEFAQPDGSLTVDVEGFLLKAPGQLFQPSGPPIKVRFELGAGGLGDVFGTTAVHLVQ
jgi:hypothetical protein